MRLFDVTEYEEDLCLMHTRMREMLRRNVYKRDYFIKSKHPEQAIAFIKFVQVLQTLYLLMLLCFRSFSLLVTGVYWMNSFFMA